MVRKLLRMTVKDLKEKCLEGEVLSYAWLPTKEMMADCLTVFVKGDKDAKFDGCSHQRLRYLLNKSLINYIRNVVGEVIMSYIFNCKKVKSEEEDESGQQPRRQESWRTDEWPTRIEEEQH